MNFEYIIARLIRKYTPNKLFDFLLQAGIGIKPGMETSDPKGAVSQYREVLTAKNLSIDKKRILLFGYGGNFGVGCLLLEASAYYVMLVDKYAHSKLESNSEVFQQVQSRICQEFLSSVAEIDSVTVIRVVAQGIRG